MDARLQRAASDGLGRLRASGGERRDRQQAAAARIDPSEYPRDEEYSSALRVQVGRGSGGLHVRGRVLPVEPVVLPQDAGARAGLSQEGPGQLVSEVRDG